MQKSSLKSFERDINNIREYLIHIEMVNKLEKNTKNLNSKFIEHLHNFNREKKIFEYKSIIISLYGILENTISKWIEEHIQNVSDIVKDYDELEDNFKNNHFDLSIKLISLIIEKRHSKFENINKNDILAKLNGVIQTSNNFELNSEAYIPLSGNLKHVKIVEAFKPLNIDLSILKHSKFMDDKLLISYMDDLVIRRNSIAHGVKEQIEDKLLTVNEFSSELEDIILALEEYMTRIFNIICEKENEYYFKHNNFIFVNETKEVFPKIKVCIINIKDIELKIGDTILVEKDSKFSKVTIISIEQDNNPVQSANNGELGLKLDALIKENSKIWKKII